MCAYLVQITVVKCDAQPSNHVNYLNMFYVVMNAERVGASFDNQTQSEYYVGNRYVSIEGIPLENFSAVPKTDINSTTPLRQRHAVFHYFYLMIENSMLPLLL